MEDWTTRGKTVLITGAARGLGAEAARRVAARGANVALVGLEPEELERVAAQCGANAAWFECDVTDTEALKRAVQGTVERFGGIDVVMANAGIAPVGMVRSTDPAAFERTIEINLLGVWRTVRAALPASLVADPMRASSSSDQATCPSAGSIGRPSLTQALSPPSRLCASKPAAANACAASADLLPVRQ